MQKDPSKAWVNYVMETTAGTGNFNVLQSGGGTINKPKEVTAVSKTPIFKAGGEMRQKNVIPDGVLHSEKNELGDKGIPVVDKEGEKHMEVEKEELILNHENTVKLKSMVDSYMASKDKNDLIEMGKFMAEEIIENTDDKTNSFKEVKS